MATMEILGEPKELNLSQNKNILVNQDYSKTINAEFNKVLQDAGNTGSSYEKRLEKLNDQVSFNAETSQTVTNQNFSNIKQDQIQEYKTDSQESPKTYEKNNRNSDVASSDNKGQEKVSDEAGSKDHSENNYRKDVNKQNSNHNSNNIDARMQAVMLNTTMSVQNRMRNVSTGQSENKTVQSAYYKNNFSANDRRSDSTQNVKSQTNNANGLSNALKTTVNRNDTTSKQDKELHTNVNNNNSNQSARINNQNLKQNNQQISVKTQNEVNSLENRTNRVTATNENLQKLLKDENVTVTVNSQEEAQPVHSKNQNITGKNKNLGDKTAVKTDLSDNAKAVTTKLNLQQNSAESDLKDQDHQESGENTALKSDNNQLYNSQVEVSSFKTASFDRILDTNQAKPVVNTSVMDQITQKTSELNPNTTSNITIELNPENLGKVQINLVSQDGNLTAQITTENSQVKDELTKGLEDLKQNLINQGISVDKLVIHVQEPASSNNNYSNMHQDQTFQGFDQPKSDSSSYRQTPYQEGSSSYANSNSTALEEETTPNTVANDNYFSSRPAVSGRVDYLI